MLVNEKTFYDTYLSLLKISERKAPTFEFLKILYNNHIETIAYSNLDFKLRRKVSLKPEDIIQKFVNEHKSGICYELTYAFYNLLLTLGYNAQAIFVNLEKIDNLIFKPSETAHAAILVHFDNNVYLLDVGFGNTFRNPICLNGDITIEQKGSYRIIKKNNSKHPYILQKKKMMNL